MKTRDCWHPSNALGEVAICANNFHNLANVERKPDCKTNYGPLDFFFLIDKKIEIKSFTKVFVCYICKHLYL